MLSIVAFTTFILFDNILLKKLIKMKELKLMQKHIFHQAESKHKIDMLNYKFNLWTIKYVYLVIELQKVSRRSLNYQFCFLWVPRL